ncbi:MAG: hypothetical protein ACE3JN_04975 [Ectobacillus sp.]
MLIGNERRQLQREAAACSRKSTIKFNRAIFIDEEKGKKNPFP